jgi:hypothetical protein
MFHLIVKDSMYVYVYYVNVVWKKSNTPELDRLDVAKIVKDKRYKVFRSQPVYHLNLNRNFDHIFQRKAGCANAVK